MRSVIVLGATGSIGRQSLEVAHHLGLHVEGIAARRAGNELAALAARHPEASVIAVEPDAEGERRFTEQFDSRYASGQAALLELVQHPDCTVINGIVGAAGLEASLAVLRAGNRLGLANKESLVAGGPLVLEALRSGGEMIPIDSEHSALFQCMVGEDRADISRLVLTASGGPFLGKKRAELADVTRGQALAHPTWAMGPRVTIDSATLVNKGLEVIEAHFLFGLAYDAIDVVIHPQSIVHSLVEFRDGSLKAHMGATDMRIPIQYALTYPARADGVLGRFDLTGLTLEFEDPDRETFPALDLAYAAGRAGGTMPAVFNAADEVAVAAFLDGRIGFLEVVGVIGEVMEAHEKMDVTSIGVVHEADQWARVAASDQVESR